MRRVSLRLRPREYQLLEQEAARHGVRPSQLAAGLLEGAEPVASDREALWQELARTAANLTQLAAHVGRLPVPEPALMADILETRGAPEALRSSLVGMGRGEP